MGWEDNMSPEEAIEAIDEILEEIEDNPRKERTAEFLSSVRDTLEEWNGEFITDTQEAKIQEIYEETFGSSCRRKKIAPKTEVQQLREVKEDRTKVDIFTKAMLRILGDHADDLDRHNAAAELMAKTLEDLGYQEGVKVWRDIYSMD